MTQLEFAFMTCGCKYKGSWLLKRCSGCELKAKLEQTPQELMDDFYDKWYGVPEIGLPTSTEVAMKPKAVHRSPRCECIHHGGNMVTWCTYCLSNFYPDQRKGNTK